MKRVLVLAIIVLAILAIPTTTHDLTKPIIDDANPLEGPSDLISLSSASGTGDSRAAVRFASRQVNSLSIPITNSYTSTSVHSAELDLSSYLIPGWSLYKVEIQADTMTAIAEHESMNIAPDSYITIQNYTGTPPPPVGTVRDALYQEFYQQPHDGKLENYTFTYRCSFYSASLGHAYLGVRSDYSDPQTNMTGWLTPFSQSLTDTVLTHDVSSENAVLNANTDYFVVIDGTGMQGFYSGNWFFNTIQWKGTSSTTGLETGYSIRDDGWYIYAGLDPYEAGLDYTYTPWNQTSSSALVYTSPTQVSLKGNSSNLQGTSWTFTDPTNITQIDLNSNQSINLDYDLTLWYKQTTTTTTDWTIPSSGADVEWSVETTIEYPETTQANYLNISIPSSWDSDGLYNSTHPANNHTTYSSTGTIITCSQLYNETWTLELTSENLMKTLKPYTTVDDTEIVTKSLMTSDIDINSTILEPDSDPITTGTVHLEIWYSGAEFLTPSDKSVTNGLVHYFWDLSNPLTTNGEYTIESQWSNGTEAGYLSTSLVLVYPTSMTADSYNIDAYTESSFDIRVTITDTFTPQYLNGTYTSLVYSFDGAANQSLTDINNGTWTASISTIGKAPGSYLVDVFAEGYALQNRSLQATVNLIHDTEALTVLWSNGDNISYVNTTELSIGYNRVGGIPLPTASVNVSIGAQTWHLPYDSGSETFKITFNGTDDFPGYGTFAISIEAGLDGHESQSDYSQTFTLHRENTNMTTDWSNGRDITYIEYTILTVGYTMSNDSPVVNAWVNITIDGRTLLLHENTTDGTYYLRFNGSDATLGFGDFDFSISAWKKGYISRATAVQTLTLREVPTLFDATWVGLSTITYVESTILSINYTMIDGTAVTSADVSVTIDGTPWILSWDGATETYRKVFNGDDPLPGFGDHNLLVNATNRGYQNHTTTSLTLTIEIELTSLEIELLPDYRINYTDYTILFVDYLMSDSSPISDGYVTMTIGGDVREVIWNGGRYELRIEGNDSSLIFGLNNFLIQCSNYGFASASNSSYNVTLSQQPTDLEVQWSNGSNPDFFGYTFLIVEYTYNGGTPVLDADVNVSIGTHTWELVWNGTAGYYQLRFNGSDANPGVGTHSLVIRADRYGFVQKMNTAETLELPVIPTILILEWTNSSNITYIETTTLRVKYRMFNDTLISTAYVEVTIGTKTWILNWSAGSQSYELTFNGSDNPPGFGTHQIFIEASETDFKTQNSSSEYITLREEPTTMTISWSNGVSITYLTQTTLSVSYNMSDTTPIGNATVTITIGFDVWNGTWNPVSKAYEVTFRGDDILPGFGIHNLTIDASKTGFVSRSDETKSLDIDLESTTLELEWFLSDTISYVGKTVLYANFTMSNGSAVFGAYVTAVIGSANKTFEWNEISEVYSLVLSGIDPGYGLGDHQVTVQATLFGFEQRNDNTQTLTVQEEHTTVTPSWSPDYNITFFESTTLSVRYDMNNGTAIPDAILNITINTVVLNLTWNSDSKAYEYTFHGSATFPGFGDHSVELRASKYGYESVIDSTQLTIRLEDTKISFEWNPNNTITYVEETKIRIFYLFSNGTPVQDAIVNITRGLKTWDALWNGTSLAYEYSWLGSDDPPGFGSHQLQIKAWKANHVYIEDISQTLTIDREPTQIQVSWSNGNNITYVQSTKLLVNFTTSSGVVIPLAFVDVTIGTYYGVLDWNTTSQLYEKTFSGSDNPPGLLYHNVSIRGVHFGYVTTVDGSETLTLRVEPTTLTPSWSSGKNITYVESTTLSVRYEMSNGDPITGANVNVSDGTNNWTLTWNATSEAYEYIFTGSDNPPGLGSHSLTILASKWGFQDASNSLESLTIIKEPTSLVISWSNTDNITYVHETTLSVRYQMNDSTAIADAVLNVTINGYFRTLTWNESSNAYEVTIRGDDAPPGYGTYTVDIRASKFGFISIVDTTQEFTIRLEDTSISFEWDLSSTITYTGQTKIRISYLDGNDDPIEGAIVNVTFGPTQTAIWNDTSKAYEYTWFGNDDPPGLGSHQLVIRAWKVNYVAITNSSQTLTIIEEPTHIQAYWTDGNAITFVQSTTLQVNYTASDNSTILGASVYVTIGTDNWNLTWNPGSLLYEIRFNGSDVPPGLGSYGLSITGDKFGYETTVNITMTLTISGELGSISSELLEGNTISFIGYTTLAVNYTMSNGTAIPLATVNVTISGKLWNLTWHPASETYRIQFNGTDSPPGFGTHTLIVQAWRDGFDYVQATQFLTIEEEGTSLDIYWGAPNFNNVTYYDYTILYAEYKMSNGTAIQGANVNVTIGSSTWTLQWNSTQIAYSLRFNGSDSPPGLGTHDLDFEAYKFGFEQRVVSGITLILSKDPTTLGVFWIGGDNITFVENTTLSVTYRMSNGSDILGATVTATIGGTLWDLDWNATAGAYQVQFTGDQNPPGLGNFTVLIQASADVYVAQSNTTILRIQPEGTTATQSWSSYSIDWTESVIFSVDFRDSYGSLINGSTTKSVYINGTEYELLGNNGTYWIEFNNTFDLGFHNVWANFGKFGYDSATALSINFTITEAPTELTIIWSSAIIDYLGQADLTVDYYYVGSGASVPPTGALANIIIDGTGPIPLTLQGNLWVANLTGISLDLGAHNIEIRMWVYGYSYSETLEVVTVNEVSTDPLTVTWIPSNLTIEYTDLLNLTVDYSYYGGDVPGSAFVNVSIDGRPYVLEYLGGLWRVSIPGDDLGIGIRTASISAWLYGYTLQTDITANINVTEAANTFSVNWEPLSLDASYIDIVNASVRYKQDYITIPGATVQLTINGTPYLLAYNGTNDVWFFSMRASDIGLGIWNVTVTANKTGYADGWDSFILSISPAVTNLTVVTSATSIYYDEDVTIDIYYELLNTSYVSGATLTLNVDGLLQVATWETNHWTFTRSGSVLGLGIHPVSIHVVAVGFEVATDTVDIDVIAIPTSVTTTTGVVTIFAYETTAVLFTWTDVKNSVNIAGFIPEVEWPDTYSVVDLGNGSYTIEIDSTALHVGNYVLQVNFTRPGYTSGSQVVNIEIMVLPLSPIFESEIVQFENETISIVIQLFESPHATVVDWADIVIELEGIQYSLVYDNVTEHYSVEIWLATLAPGSYMLNFTASAIDCETEYGEIQLEIEPKVTYYLTLDVDEEVPAGQPIEITVSATYESGAVSGLPITVHIVIERGENAPHEITEDVLTNSEGIALLVFTVPSDASGLTIWADFEPAIGEWPATSNTVNREVTPSGFDILSFIFSLFEDPITLAIIVGGGGGSLAGLILLRRRRGSPKMSEPIATDTLAPPTTTPTAPAGEMDIIQDVIKENPNGMTRAQIAQSLEISTSKASAMVRQLLESDSGFEEIKEGRLRRIRFNPD